MRTHKVGILLSSPLLVAGLREVLHKPHGISAIDITEGLTPEEYAGRIASESLSLIITDTFLSGYCPDGVSVMLLTSCQTPDIVRDRYDAVMSVFDSVESIVEKIRSIVDPATESDPRGGDLSPRERDVIKLLVQGMSNKEIAAKMSVSVNTVMTHRRNIATKLEIHSPAGLTIFAIATGIVKLEDVAL